MASLLDTLKSNGYAGPIILVPEEIQAWVERGRIGTYLLAPMLEATLEAEDKAWNISYIGRSATDLAGRLRDHVDEGPEDTFWFQYHETPEAAYDEECRLYEAFHSTIRNERTPDKP